jgi:hypothetical protein
MLAGESQEPGELRCGKTVDQVGGTLGDHDRRCVGVGAGYLRYHGSFPNDASVIRLASALLSEQNDEWLVQRGYLSPESMALILAAGPLTDDSPTDQHDREEAVALDAA